MSTIDADSMIFGAVIFSGLASWMTNDRIAGELVETLTRATNIIEIDSTFA